MKKSIKVVLTVVCTLALVAGSVLGTLAYLSKNTEVVSNTFVCGKLFDPEEPKTPQQEDIEDDFYIYETEYTDNGDGTYTPTGELTQEGNEYTVLPGVDIPKDAKIGTNKNLAIDAFVFIEVKNTLATPLSAEVSSAWTELKSVTSAHEGFTVYTLASGAITAGNILTDTSILTGDKVTVADGELPSDPGAIEFYGHIVQAEGFKNSAADCWSAYVADLAD